MRTRIVTAASRTFGRFANPVQSAGEARLTSPPSRPLVGRDDAVVPVLVETDRRPELTQPDRIPPVPEVD